jgi:hypothetical protein
MKGLLLVVVLVVISLAAIPGSASATRGPECPGSGHLRTYDLSCKHARRVLHRFFGGAPSVHPLASPNGWRCYQRGGNHTSDGGSVYYVSCHSRRNPYVRLRFRWASDEGVPSV